MLYNVVLVSATPQCKSVLIVCVCILSLLSFPLPSYSTLSCHGTRPGSLCYIADIYIYTMCVCVYIYIMKYYSAIKRNESESVLVR